MKKTYLNPFRVFSLLFTTKKKQSEPQPTVINPPIKKELVEGSVEYFIREATKLKNSDSDKAIQLIKKAIDLEPQEHNHVLKLSTYLYKSGQKEEAYDACRELIRKLDVNDYTRYNLKKTVILEKLCTFYYSDQNFEAYLAAYTEWIYNTIIGYACQGRQKELKKILLDKNKTKQLSPTKIEGCFVKLNRVEEKEEYNSELSSMMETISEKLGVLTDAVIKARKASKTTEAMLGKLKLNETFIGVYIELNDADGLLQ